MTASAMPFVPPAAPLAHSARTSARATRDPFFDNAKFLLVVLVVIGHNWGMLIDDMRAVKAAYMVVYSFHMPAFVLLCGYFSRSFTGRPDQTKKLITGVLLPYLVFEMVYSALYSLIHEVPFTVTPTTPSYLCWFLLALFLWRLTAPVWDAVRWPVAWAALLSLAAGCTVIRYELGLPRVLYFLPWFVLGLKLEYRHFARLRGPLLRHCGLGVLLAAVGAAWWLAPRTGVAPLLGQFSHVELRMPMLSYLVTRLVLFAVAGVLTVAFLAWVPRRRAGFTALGAATMYPFLLHGLVVKAAEGYGVYRVISWAGLVGALVVTLLAVVLAVCLFSPPVRKATRWLVEPGVVLRDGLRRRQERLSEPLSVVSGTTLRPAGMSRRMSAGTPARS